MRYSFIRLIFVFLIMQSCITLSGNVSVNDSIKFSATDIEVILPKIIVSDIESDISIRILNTEKSKAIEGKEISIILNNETKQYKITDGKISFSYVFADNETISIKVDDFAFRKDVTPIPLWWSVIPPLIAILAALIFKEVYTALFLGLLFGTSIIQYYQGHSFFISIFSGVLSVVDTYLVESLTDSDHISIILFSMLIGGMVAIITKNGGMQGVVRLLSRYANNARSGQIVTWLLGIVIFFDDYANTLVVGNTMRPVTDKLKISREKLSYIVDSTAAPISAIAFITTWIGAELSYIQNGINNIGLNETAYSVFVNSLQYAFYPILTLIFVFILLFKQRDFGPMLKAERKAKMLTDYANINDKTPGNCEEVVTDNPKWYNAVIPVVVIIFGTITGLLYTGIEKVGSGAGLSQIIGNADSFKALLWASMSGVLVAIILSISQKIMKVREAVESMMNGFKTMLQAIVILILAWSIALLTEHLHTAEFISGILIYIKISPYLVPALTFFLASLIAFSTGSSWGTMAILYPIVLQATWMITENFNMDYDQSMAIFANVVSTVLAGSVLGDHCSPISDTTILSSLACSCNHVEHVRTQLPYALTVGFIAVFAGTIPAAFGVPTILLFVINIFLLYLVVRFLGKKV